MSDLEPLKYFIRFITFKTKIKPYEFAYRKGPQKIDTLTDQKLDDRS